MIASSSRLSFVTVCAGIRGSRVSARMPFRSCAIVAAACTPLPTTSPTANPSRPSGSISVSNQSPPTSNAYEPGRYSRRRVRPRAGNDLGRTLRCSVSATTARLRSGCPVEREPALRDEGLEEAHASSTSRQGCATRAPRRRGAPARTDGRNTNVSWSIASSAAVSSG